MAETITAGADDKAGSLIRPRLLNGGEAADWRTTPGFRYAVAYDLIKHGEVYKTVYEIYGEGLPASNYGNATAGSSYLDLDHGHEYRALFDDDGTLMWALTVNLILQAEGDTEIGNIDSHPMGQLVVDSGDGNLYIKTNASVGDDVGNNILVGDQTP